MATDVPRSATLQLPSWFWGGDIPGYFNSAQLRVGRSGDLGDVTVETLERVERRRPNLVRTVELAGPNVATPPPRIGVIEAAALKGLERASIVGELDIQPYLHRVLERAQTPGAIGLASGFAAHQMQTMAAPVENLDQVIADVHTAIKAISLADSDRAAFPHSSVHFIQRDQGLLHRTKLASVLLRLHHDHALRNADLLAVTEASERGELIFAASSGIGEGLNTLDAYLAPLLGAMTPFVWAFPAIRASGTIVYALGSQIRGTEESAAEPMQLLPSQGASSSSSAPRLSSRSAAATITWWIRRLDGMLGVLSDPAVYTDSELRYVPSKHLHAQLSMEQLFRRTASIQRAHRDTDARRVLLFTTLDTLQKLTNRTLQTMCSLSFARRTLEELRGSLSGDVAMLLLPAAERAVDALAEVQNGFYMAHQSGRREVEFVDNDGVAQKLDLADAAAEYVRVLRNATHGHGSNREDSKPRTDALLAHHDGDLHHDLALLGYLYLLDLLTHPDNLRRTLWAAGRS